MAKNTKPQPQWAQRFVGEDVVPAAELVANPHNFRRHPKAQRAAMTATLDTVGWIQRVIVNRTTGRIVDGHLRVEEAAQRGESVPVVYVELSEDEERAALLTFDPLGALAQEDTSVLDELLADHRAIDLDVDRGNLVDLLYGRIVQDGLTDPDAVPEAPEPVTKLGDLWALGDHRLLCGDATNGEDVARLMDGETVAAVLTDPPYRMGKDMSGDDLDDESFAQLHIGFMEAAPVREDATMVCFHGTRAFPVAIDAGRITDWQFKRMLWLSKPNDVTFPWRGWILQSEAILVMARGKGNWVETHPFHHDTYEFNHRGGELPEGVGWHPTVKPAEVVKDLMSRIVDRSEALFDPFVGSGTSIIAAEQLGRRCYAMEIDPMYCDVARIRWEEFTGRKAELVT